MPIRRREHKVIVPRFMFDKESILKAPNKIESDYRNHNLKIFENYVMFSVKEQFKYELDSILSAYALPQCMMKTILENRGITPSVFESKTGLSHTVHARITKKADLNLKLSTLINICWSLKIEYPIAKRLIEAYGYNLNGSTKNILAYKYVLKYMMHWDLDTVEKFLEENQVPLFK